MQTPDCRVWSAQGTRSPRNNLWLLFRLRKISAEAKFCADFPTSLLRYPHSFQSEACEFCFCAEQRRFNTFFQHCSSTVSLCWSEWSDDMIIQETSRWACGVRLQQLSGWNFCTEKCGMNSTNRVDGSKGNQESKYDSRMFWTILYTALRCSIDV